jgi:integrase
MAKRRTYKRDRRGRFASTGSTRVKRITPKVNRRRPRYVRGSLGKTLRVGRVGPGGEYAGVHVGANPDELLWSRPDGQPMRPPTRSHWFGAAVKRCQAADDKFPRVTVHELRHTAASLMIASGANVKTVQAQLGHKSATMTLDQYGHLFPDDLDDVADKMDDLVSGCAQNVPTKETGQG